MQDIIETDELHYKPKHITFYNFNEYILPMAFLKDIHERYLWIKDADNDQSNFAAELKNLDKGTEKIEKNFF